MVEGSGSYDDDHAWLSLEVVLWYVPWLGISEGLRALLAAGSCISRLTK